MKPARLAILAIALVAGVGAAFMVAGSRAPEQVKRVSVNTTPMEDVLVAANEIPFGGTIADGDLRWQAWPKASIPPGAVLRDAIPNAVQQFRGSLSRSSLGPGEPIYQERLIQPGKAGFMAAILRPGYRAVAINIDAQGSTSAGGFILPNDHVDVIHTFKDDDAARAGGDGMVSETILHNVRVLAIGQTVEEQNNQKVVVGSNATLELTPDQVEKIVLAQRVGQLSLSLRSMADSNAAATNGDDTSEKSGDVTIVRFGIPIQTRPH